MNKPIVVNDTNFDQTVLHAETPVLVDFWAPWCGPCLMVAPILDELAEEYSSKVTITRLDVDQSPRIAARYRIMSIPTLLIFKNGQPFSQIVGYKSKTELRRSLDTALD